MFIHGAHRMWSWEVLLTEERGLVGSGFYGEQYFGTLATEVAHGV